MGRIPMYSSPGWEAVPMPQMSADSAGVSVESKLEPKDRLIPCQNTESHLKYFKAWYKIDLETQLKRQGIAGCDPAIPL